MTNNDVLRSIRYSFDFSDADMISIFSQAELKVTRAEVSDWLKQDEDPDYKECNDVTFATFLNGLINFKRGKREGAQPEPEEKLNNNIIFRKLKIALDLKAEDIIDLTVLANFKISKPELSSFFRKETHKNYRECKDQILRYFLKGIQLKHRP